jgi:hypothetical protein
MADESSKVGVPASGTTSYEFHSDFDTTKVRIDHNISLGGQGDSVAVEVFIEGQSYGKSTLTPSSPSASFDNFDFGETDVGVTLTADFQARQLAYEVTFTMVIPGADAITSIWKGSVTTWVAEYQKEDVGPPAQTIV